MFLPESGDAKNVHYGPGAGDFDLAFLTIHSANAPTEYPERENKIRYITAFIAKGGLIKIVPKKFNTLKLHSGTLPYVIF